MPELRAWCDCQAVPTAVADGCLAELARAGISIIRADPGPEPYPHSSTPAIVLYSDAGPRIVERVRQLRRSADARVLAVGVGAATAGDQLLWDLLAAGASDALRWESSRHPTEDIRARLERWRAVDRLAESPLVRRTGVGESHVWRGFLREVVEVGHFTSSSILLIGETGTGKELVARLIHQLDARPAKRDLTLLDCTTIAPELSGSEFFGHERGAFTHAVAARDGAFALADGGTLFLDEVGELPPTVQAELLRVVQEHTYKRVGGNTWRRAEFRLVCATNRDLGQEVEELRFRRDFYYRIAAWTLRVPSLEERREDILPLARHFLGELYDEDDVPDFDAAVRGYLLARPYPGNVRDLRQLVLRIGRRHVGRGPITVGDLPEDERRSIVPAASDWRGEPLRQAVRLAMQCDVGLKELTAAAAETAIEVALEYEAGSTGRAAKRLGVTSRALQMRRAHKVTDGEEP